MEYEDLNNDGSKKVESRFVITDREEIEEHEHPILRSIKFIQFINTSDAIKHKKNQKDKLKGDLVNSLNRLNDLLSMINLATAEKSPIQFKSLSQMQINNDQKSKQKLLHINYLKKADHFAQSINAFKSEMRKQKSISLKTQAIFKELQDLKEIGFHVDESFLLPKLTEDGDISIELENRYIKNFSQLIKTQKHKFLLKSKTTDKISYQMQEFDLTSNFIETFLLKYIITFELELHLDNELLLSYDHIKTNELLNSLFIKTTNYYRNNKYESKLKSFIPFYLKYLLYQFCKREILELMKVNNTNNIFTYKNMIFIISKNANDYSVTCNFFNHFQLIFKCFKKDVASLQNDEDVDMTYSPPSNPPSSPPHVENIIKIFLNNLIYDIKLYSNIKDFYNKITNTHALIDVIDYGTLIKNMGKVSNILLQRALIGKIKSYFQSKKSYSMVMTKHMYLSNDTMIYRFHIAKINNLTCPYTSVKIEFNLIFSRNKGITIELKEPYKNFIYIVEKDYYTFYQAKRFDINFILHLLDNLLV